MAKYLSVVTDKPDGEIPLESDLQLELEKYATEHEAVTKRLDNLAKIQEHIIMIRECYS